VDIPESLEFEILEPASVPVKIKEKGKVVNYILKEGSSGDVIKYRDACLGAARFNEQGRPVAVVGMSEAEPLFLSLCLFRVGTNDKGVERHEKVGIQAIKAWPNPVVNKLFNIAKKISGVDEDDSEETIRNRIKADQEKLDQLLKKDDPVKNEQENTTDTSDLPES
jgi:hypothetical protein